MVAVQWSTSPCRVWYTTAKMPRAKKRNLLGDIHSLQLMRAVVCLVAAVGLTIVLWDIRFPLDVTYLTRDLLASQQSTVFVPALRTIWDIPLAVAAVPFAISAVFAYYAGLRGRRNYEAGLKKEQARLRWFDLGLSGALLFEIAALLGGITNVVMLKLGALLIVITCGLGWLADQQNAKNKQPHYGAFSLAIVSGVLPWLMLGSSLLLSWLYGAVRLPWYSYAVPAVVLIGFSVLAIIQLLGYRRYKSFKNYQFVECNVVGLDMVLKATVAGLLVLSFWK